MTKAGIRNRLIPTTADTANTAVIHGRLRRSNDGSMVSSFLETRRVSRFCTQGFYPVTVPGQKGWRNRCSPKMKRPDPRSRTGALGEAGYRLYCGVKFW